MTKYKFQSERDKKLINDAFHNIAYLIFGRNNQTKINDFYHLFDSEVKEVNIYPQGTRTNFINAYCPGICRKDPQDDKIVIEMLGYKDAVPSQYLFLEHEATHEFSHAFVDLLPYAFAKQEEGYVRNGIRYKNVMGFSIIN